MTGILFFEEQQRANFSSYLSASLISRLSGILVKKNNRTGQWQSINIKQISCHYHHHISCDFLCMVQSVCAPLSSANCYKLARYQVPASLSFTSHSVILEGIESCGIIIQALCPWDQIQHKECTVESFFIHVCTNVAESFSITRCD